MPKSGQQSVISSPSAVAGAADDGQLTTDSPIHDCWNVIGVEGNGTCRELVKFIHCRNCPVYSAAGIQLLDRPLPADYRRERAEHYAQEKKFAKPERLSVVIFRLANEWLALPTTVFQEVAERRAVHSLPHHARMLPGLGLVNVRGELLICVSVAGLLGLNNLESHSATAAGVSSPKSLGTPATVLARSGTRRDSRLQTLDARLQTLDWRKNRLLVTSWNGQRLAFPVDEVYGIQRFPKDELRDPPAKTLNAEGFRGHTQGVFRWHDHTVGLLDPDSFFGSLNRSLAQ